MVVIDGGLGTGLEPEPEPEPDYTTFYYSDDYSDTSTETTITASSYTVPNDKSLIRVEIGQDVVSIADSAFYNAFDLTSITFTSPSSLAALELVRSKVRTV